MGGLCSCWLVAIFFLLQQIPAVTDAISALSHIRRAHLGLAWSCCGYSGHFRDIIWSCYVTRVWRGASIWRNSIFVWFTRLEFDSDCAHRPYHRACPLFCASRPGWRYQAFERSQYAHRSGSWSIRTPNDTSTHDIRKHPDIGLGLSFAFTQFEHLVWEN